MTDTAQLAAPVCFVDIYPYEGGSYKLQGGPLRKVQTTKNIGGNAGNFQIVLAPEPPSGALSWTQILTPMSFVVIGMQRGKNAGVVMCGFVTSVQESQTWDSGNTVQRSIVVTGVDTGYYFQMIDFYSLWLIPLLGGGSPSLLAQGLTYGDPGDIAKTWYEQVMKGASFVNTKVTFEGAQIPFPTFMASRFDNYDVTVPFGDYFLGIDGAWYNKFHGILPFPFYEFFVTTAQDATTYAAGTQATSPSSSSSAGYGFPSTGLSRQYTGTPTVVARLNPVPQLVSSVGSKSVASFDSIDTKLWNALPQFDLGGDQFFMQSIIAFTDEEVFNFYAINPTWMTAQQGDNNSNLNQFMFNYAGVVDLASIVRYGYRPNQHTTQWISDMTGQIAQAGMADLPSLMATLVGRYCGYFEATPLMGRGSVTTFLRPDIQIGCKLLYQPYNDRRNWLFYIDGVQHTWSFGAGSSTTLTISRGLPANVYNNPQLLFDIHIGNAERIDGEYKSGLPPGSLQPLTALSPDIYAQWMLQLTQIYMNPQQVSAHP